MLVLSRKESQKIHVGENITITIVRIRGGAVRLGIEAPSHVQVLRNEVKEALEKAMHLDD